MSRNIDPRRGRAAVARSVVVSAPGAAIRVERIELTGELLRSLTTNLTSLGPRTERPRRSGRAEA